MRPGELVHGRPRWSRGVQCWRRGLPPCRSSPTYDVCWVTRGTCIGRRHKPRRGYQVPRRLVPGIDSGRVDATTAVSAMALSAKPRAVILLAIGLALLAGATVAFYFSVHDAQLLSSYNAAPVCPTLTDALAGKECRYSGTATVLYTSQESGTAYIYFALPDLNDRQFSARLPLFIRPD